jgi:hypothetical protein
VAASTWKAGMRRKDRIAVRDRMINFFIMPPT